MKWFRQPVYPYLFALFTVLVYFSRSPLSATIESFSLTALLSLALTFLLTSLLALLIKDRQKSALIASLMLVPFFTYGRLSVALGPTKYFKTIYHYHLPLLIIGLIFLIGTWLTLRTKVFPSNLTKLFTVFTVLLTLISTVAVFNSLRLAAKAQASLTVPELTIGDSRPDIYYLVFDEYTGPKALKDLYGFDDSQITSGLKDRGFYVPDNSTSNYFGSLHSLAATFNLKYLDGLTAKITSKTSDQAVLEDLAENNRLVLSLKDAGYQYYHLGSWWEPTSSNRNADTNFFASSFLNLPTFTTHYFTETTMVMPVLGKFFSQDSNRKTVEYQQEKTVELAAESNSPKFVFTHFILPHGPNIYRADCTPLSTAESAASEGNVHDYLGQVACTNSIILSLVDKILAASPTPPIIVVQSDEGQELKYDAPKDASSLPQSLQEKYSILNAFYFPDKDYTKLYPTITSVNTFRVILDQYLGAKLPLKPDQNFILDEYYAINRSTDVTQQVQKAVGNK